MSLTATQFARASAAEASHQRMLRLQRMNYYELQRLLQGDAAHAALWIRSAAEYGLPAAQLRIGRMLLAGSGVPRDALAAFWWFKRAADGGDAEALNMLGRCHECGWGTPPDLPRAAASYRASARRGHDWGEYNFANMLFDGRGVPRDRAQALCWYLRAAGQGHGRAMNLVGRCLEQGWGCAPCPADALHYYRQSAQSGYFRGQFNYALVLVESGQAATAADWFCKAAQSGDAPIRRAIAAVLSTTADPALLRVRAQVTASSD
jgi:TPR repeat protein